jgi:predicted RNase H-like nuclease
MHFVGVDLAWSARNQTGIAVLNNDGHLIRICAAITDDAIIEAVQPYVREECLVAIDAPLIVPNPDGFRLAETLLNRDSGDSRPTRNRRTPTIHYSTHRARVAGRKTRA